MHDRELQLHDGTRLLRKDRFDALAAKLSLSAEEMASTHGIYPIHPDFFIAATATPPPPKSASGGGKEKKAWLTPEMLSLFFYHRVPRLSVGEEEEIVSSFVSLCII